MASEDFIKQLSEKTGSTPEKIRKELETIIAKFKETNPEKSPEVIEMNARNQLKAKYKPELQSGQKRFTGMIFSVGNVRNNMKKTYDSLSDTVEQYKANNELGKAVSEGLVRIDEKGNEIILYPKVTKGGQESRLGGQDFILETRNTREVTLITASGDQPKLTILEIQGEWVNNFSYQPGSIVSFLATTNRQSDSQFFQRIENVIYLQTRRDSFALEIDEELYKIVNNLFAEDILKIFPQHHHKVEEYYRCADNKDIPSDLRGTVLLTNAVVTDIDVNPSKKKNIKIYIDTDGDEVSRYRFSVILPDTFTNLLKFAQGSKVVVLGRISLATEQNNKDEINGLLCFGSVVAPYKDFFIPAKDIEPLTASDMPKAQPKKLEVF